MNDNYEITFSPTSKQLSQIEKWLIEYDIKTKDGFYCNWQSIQRSFYNNELTTITVDNQTVGFAIWCMTSNITARIEIVEIKPSHRLKGIGIKLINHLIEFLKDKNICVIDLQCAPADSEPFWKHMGFIEFPYPPEKYKLSSNGNKKLYKVLTEALHQSFALQNDETIELWADEPFRTNETTPPSYIWNLDFIDDTRRLKNPIIQPASFEWRIRWTKNGKVIKDNKIKRFATEIDFSSFIVINELPL